MKRLIVTALIMLMPSVAWATAETLHPDTDNTDGAAVAYAASPGCASGTACTATNCALNVDDSVASGDAAHVSGATCNGTAASDWTQTFNFSNPTVGNTWNNWQTLAMRYFEPVSDGTDPTWSSVVVRCAAASIVTCNSWTAFNGTTEVTDTTSCTFDATMAAGCSPNDVYVQVTCAASGGSPSGRRSCALDAIEIQGDFVFSGRRRAFISAKGPPLSLTDVMAKVVRGWFSPMRAEASVLP